MTPDEASADAALSDARQQAHAWLCATLASLPEAVTSLSVGAEFVDPDDRPNLEPRLRAVIGGRGATRFPEDHAIELPPGHDDAWEAIELIADDLRTHTAPFLFALPVDGWVTVTREELATASELEFRRSEERVERQWRETVNALQPGETRTLLLHRNADGVLTLRAT